jgi:hypothetical protein
MGPTYGSISAIINHYEAALGVIVATFITSSSFDSIDRTLMATTATHQLDVATLPAPGTLAIGAT